MLGWLHASETGSVGLGLAEGPGNAGAGTLDSHGCYGAGQGRTRAAVTTPAHQHTSLCPRLVWGELWTSDPRAAGNRANASVTQGRAFPLGAVFPLAPEQGTEDTEAEVSIKTEGTWSPGAVSGSLLFMPFFLPSWLPSCWTSAGTGRGQCCPQLSGDGQGRLGSVCQPRAPLCPPCPCRCPSRAPTGSRQQLGRRLPLLTRAWTLPPSWSLTHTALSLQPHAAG